MPTPQYCPSPRELDDLELLLSGAHAPRARFDALVSLHLPDDLRDAAEGDGVELVDPEGLPLALISRKGLTPLAAPAYGPFRRLHLSPDTVRREYPESMIVPVAGPLTEDDLDRIAAARRDVVLLALNGTGTPQGLTPVGLVRATLAAASLLIGRGVAADVVAVPLPAHGDAESDHQLGARVVANYAPHAEHGTTGVLGLTGEGELPESIADIVEHDQPEDDERGTVVFFTGLSGSGKSTLARALHDLVLEMGLRTVTSLDGDVVRRNLSAGLSFSKADRETNIRRIGWVAAEIARHHGVAICSPIAPFDQTRQQVRSMVEEAGGVFVLVHVATPLEECERRDRKGLYAKARAGEIPEFTGISSPYEIPEDATVRIDTTGRSISDCLKDLLPHLPFHPQSHSQSRSQDKP